MAKKQGKKAAKRVRRRIHRLQHWSTLSKADLVRRIGKRLGVAFSDREDLGPGGKARWLAEVGHDAWVALEVERKQAHPVQNVLRYWPWLDRSRRRLVLVHVIAPGARRRRGAATDLTLWLGALMERALPGRFTYCRVELGSKGEAAQLGIAREAVLRLRHPRTVRGLVAGL